MMGFGGFGQQRQVKPFHPNQVPQIAAGEIWVAGAGLSGGATRSWAGRNGTNTVTTPSAQESNVVTGPGGFPTMEFLSANSDVWTASSPAGPLTATDGLYLAFWVHFNPLDTVFRTAIEQYGNAGGRKWNVQKTASLSAFQMTWSDDGTNLLVGGLAATEAENVGVITMLDKLMFCEWAIDPALSTLAEKTRLWLDMRLQTLTTLTGTGGASLFNGGVFRIGNNNFENQDMAGLVSPILVGRKVNGVLVPTLAHRIGLMNYLSPKDRRFKLIAGGNSVTAGQNASVPFVTSYPGVLRSSLVSAGHAGRVVHDRGLGGMKTSDMIADFSTRVLPFYDPGYNKNVYVFFEVRNSTQASVPVETIQAEHVTLGRMAQEAGLYVVVGTAPGSDGAQAGQGTPGQVNAWIRANWQTFAHQLIDFENHPAFSPSGNILNPTMYSDGVHLTDAGYAILASEVFNAIKNRAA